MTQEPAVINQFFSRLVFQPTAVPSTSPHLFHALMQNTPITASNGLKKDNNKNNISRQRIYLPFQVSQLLSAPFTWSALPATVIPSATVIHSFTVFEIAIEYLTKIAFV
jgi:hypothetical protein